MKRSLVWLAFAILLCACAVSQSDGCIPPPEGFTSANMVGTWVDVSGPPGSRDTLIIRADGTYKQIIHLENTENPPFDYESDWQAWRLEFADNGIAYQHMDGMRLCAYSGGYIDCDVVGGGDSPEAKWYDFCEKEWIQMPGEGILIVQGRPPGPGTPEPDDVSLFLPQRGEDIWGYWLVETPTLTAPTSPR